VNERGDVEVGWESGSGCMRYHVRKVGNRDEERRNGGRVISRNL